VTPSSSASSDIIFSKTFMLASSFLIEFRANASFDAGKEVFCLSKGTYEEMIICYYKKKKKYISIFIKKFELLI